MKYTENREVSAREVFKTLIYEWTFESATFHQFIELNVDSNFMDFFWYSGAKALKDFYDWDWCGGYHHSDNWDSFAEYFTNKIFDAIPEIIKDVMNDNGIEKGEDYEKEIEIDFSKYGLYNILYHKDDIIFDVVRFVYENFRCTFREMISEMLNDMGYHNINFEVKFKG